MGALPNIDVKWTGGGVTKSFTNALLEQNWTYVSGGTGLLAAGDYPGTGSTLQFLDSVVALPAVNLPNAGEVFAIVIRDDRLLGTDWGYAELTLFLGDGTWSYSSIVLGPTAQAQTIGIGRDGAVGATVTAYNWIFIHAVPFTNSTFTSLAGSITVDLESIAIANKITMVDPGEFGVEDGVTATLNGGLDVSGSIRLASSTDIIDSASPINFTGVVAIDWNGGIIYGGLNANGYTVTHSNPTGAKLVCDQNGTLDLGADVALLDVEIAANVTLGRNLVCHTFTHTSGAITFSGFKITCDHFVQGAGTFADHGIIDIGDHGALKTEVAAADDVRSGTGRWTGATGANVGTMSAANRSMGISL
jgi:hypothetical protein